jgi:endonuclease YncB( thermonuclease family)
VSKHWKPAKKTVALGGPARPSRIRRDPVRLVESPSQVTRTAVRTRGQEVWGGVTGVLLMTLALVVVVVGVSIATIVHDDPAADARALQYDQCYDGGRNCVVDGGTIRVAGEKVVIARVDAPEIQGAACPEEREEGIDAATRLASLLNSGTVTLSAPFRDPYGRQVRSVEVKGADVASWMISAGIAHEYGFGHNWCA